MSGHCLCGDPYCPACGDPRGAFLADLEWEAGLPDGTLDAVLRGLAGADPVEVQKFMRRLESEMYEAWTDRELGGRTDP